MEKKKKNSNSVHKKGGKIRQIVFTNVKNVYPQRTNIDVRIKHRVF